MYFGYQRSFIFIFDTSIAHYGSNSANKWMFVFNIIFKCGFFKYINFIVLFERQSVKKISLKSQNGKKMV